jgi:hypothetical protein
MTAHAWASFFKNVSGLSVSEDVPQEQGLCIAEQCKAELFKDARPVEQTFHPGDVVVKICNMAASDQALGLFRVCWILKLNSYAVVQNQDSSTVPFDFAVRVPAQDVTAAQLRVDFSAARDIPLQSPSEFTSQPDDPSQGIDDTGAIDETEDAHTLMELTGLSFIISGDDRNLFVVNDVKDSSKLDCHGGQVEKGDVVVYAGSETPHSWELFLSILSAAGSGAVITFSSHSQGNVFYAFLADSALASQDDSAPV